MNHLTQSSKRSSQFQLPTSSLHHGNAFSILKTLEPDSVDLVCTDPPYGIGFMGKAWDKFGPGSHGAASNRAFQEFIASVGRELLRVMKPGAFIFMSMAPRQDSLARAIAGLEDAGFKVGFTSMYWTFASGFPKAMNIGKAADKRECRQRKMLGRNPNSRRNATTENSLYKPGTVGKTAFITVGDHPLEGAYGGFQPKPAVEVIIVAMKPLREKAYSAQAQKNGKGVTWLDDARIPIGIEQVPRLNKAYERKGGKNFGDGDDGRLGSITGHESSGRFPANLLVSDDVLAEYSRFFSLDAVAAQRLPFLIVPKASKREKNEGLSGFKKQKRAGLPLRASGGKRGGIGGDGSATDRTTTAQNIHPTVKPVQLMQYLITLGSRPGDVVLDPFLGSGTSGIAAKLLGRHFIGIEREAEYIAIARARIRATNPTTVP